jgi:cellulose synthase/poly-beta-1,6-N-acetylglucosamine synthase-like glycosyltransferase
VITCLIPAHNEEQRVAAAISSIKHQVDRVIVVADNCVDGTVEVARAHGAEVFETSGNTLKKAGALNQALEVLLPQSDNRDFFFMLDADSEVNTTFVSQALSMFRDPNIGAVGGIFYGEEGAGLIGQFQRNEFFRYANDVAYRRYRAMVVTGTAGMFRARVLAQVAAGRRSGLLPRTEDAQAVGVFDTAALTEDNELTLAIKTLGFECVSPPGCHVKTEVMPTWKALWRQRYRWMRGAIENLTSYGFTKITRKYWTQQASLFVGAIALGLYWLYFLCVLLLGQLALSWWLLLMIVFIAERVYTVRKAGWRGMSIAAVIYPEIAYDMVILATFLWAAIGAVFGRKQDWHHVAWPVDAKADTPTSLAPNGAN